MKEKKHFTSSGKRSKTKGHRFESEVAELLTVWSGLKHRRVPLSGGWSACLVGGDVFCEPEYASAPERGESLFVPISWECKKQESWDFAQLFKKDEKCPLFAWWEQTVRSAEKIKKIPALVFTRNYQPIFIMIRCLIANKINDLVSESWRDLTHMVCYVPDGSEVAILLFKDFLSWVPFKTLIKLTV